MVKPLCKICLLFLFCALFISGCNNDLLGLITSTDISVRLKERDNFVFLGESERNPSFGEEYSFIVLSDTHIENGDAWNLEDLRNVIEQSNGEIKFVAFTGDITQNGDKKDVDKFIDVARSFGVPCYPVIGNHDIFFGNFSVWKEKIGSTCYRINADGTTLFILDSANAIFGKEQIDWLERELTSAHGRVFVFSHSNFFVKSPTDIQQHSDINERGRVVSLLRNKCDIMFMGHSHKRIINEAGGVLFINNEDFVNHRAYCVVSVKKDGISYKFEKL